MARIWIGGAGGAPSNNFIRSLRESPVDDYLIGTSCVASDLFLAQTDEKHVVPVGTDPAHPGVILNLVKRTAPDFLHVQHDYEVLSISRIRDEIQALGTRLFLPSHATIETCVDKYRTYCVWRDAGIRVPPTLLIETPADLRHAFRDFGPRIWLRATVGGGGRGALPTDNPALAEAWLNRFEGWGNFTAARCLTRQTVTWLSIWHQGLLVVAQSRRRRRWNFGDRTLSGVTGITGVGETCCDPLVDTIAQAAIRAVDSEPNGIFGVDMTLDDEGVPNPTEINIGRFFTTHYFFTRAGLNMPRIYCDLGLGGAVPQLSKRVNPLPEGLVWIRGMDVEPVLTTRDELERMEAPLAELRSAGA